MNATLLTRSGVPTEQLLLDEQIQDEARAVVAEAHDRKPAGIFLKLDDGEEIELPQELSNALIFALHGMTQGSVSMRAIPKDLTTSTAASVLGVSRPTLMKLIESKELPSTKVGSHHRLSAQDVFDLKARRDQKRLAAFEDLRRIDMELDAE